MSLLTGPVNIEDEWIKWKAQHGKTYVNDEEESNRFKIFETNVKSIAEHNEKYQNGEITFSRAINKFADLTAEEVPKGLKSRIGLPRQQ